MEINLAEYIGEKVRVLSGYEFGRWLRRVLQLNRLDRVTGMTVTIKIPDKLYSLNVSFFLGLFEDSMKYLGVEHFRRKYLFTCTPEIRRCVEDGIRHTYLSVMTEKWRKEDRKNEWQHFNPFFRG